MIKAVLFAAELLLVATLSYMDAQVFTVSLDPEYVRSGELSIPAGGSQWMVLAILISLAMYMLCKMIWRPNGGFRLLAALTLLAYVPAILSHARLDWILFFSERQLFATSISHGATVVLFTGTLAALVVLGRLIVLGERTVSLNRQRAEATDSSALIFSEILVSIGLIAVSLAGALGVIGLATALSD